jgi:hypothetical protein
MSEILINTSTAGVQQDPAIASFAGSLYLTVWTDRRDLTIKGQILDADGDKFRDEFVVNTPTPAGGNISRHLPAITTTGGGLVAVWIEKPLNPGLPRPHVKLQRFNREGQKLGPEVQVSTSEVDATQRPAVASMIDGGFLVVWVDPRREQRIRAQRFNIDGMKTGPEFSVNSSEGSHEQPIATRIEGQFGGEFGNYVVAWRSDPFVPGGGAITYQIFKADGQRIGSELVPNISGFAGEKAITFLDDGRFVIAHVRNGVVSDIGVRKSIVEANIFTPGEFDSQGRPERIAMTGTSERDINASWPAVAALPGGRFVLAWVQKKAETFSTSPTAKARVFSAGRLEPLGAEIQLNTATAGDRFSVRVATARGQDGESAFIVWGDSSQTGGDTSDFAVRGRGLRVLAGAGGFA